MLTAGINGSTAQCWANPDLENFWRYIAKSEVPIEESDHLSPVTVAKGIEYGVSLLGCFIEAYVGSKQGLGKDAAFGKITRAALEFARGTFAAWHRYRLPEDLLST